MKELWVEKTNSYLCIHDLVKILSEHVGAEKQTMMDMLLAIYILTGCDTVSYPFRQGKKKAAKLALKNVGNFSSFASFGNMETSLELKSDIIKEAREVFVSLYGFVGFDSLDVLREHAFAKSKGDLRCIPPTEDAFYLHLQRALYQLAIYKRAHLSHMNLPSPTDFGWQIVNGGLSPILMLKLARPERERPTYCNCTRSKCLRNCSCSKYNVECITACKCIGRPDKCRRAARVELEDSEYL